MRVTKDKEERRKEFMVIAKQFFVKKGFYETKISDLVKEAKVAQGTFYYHFKTKEAILLAILEELVKGMGFFIRSITKDTTLSATERIEKIMILLFQTPNEHDPMHQLIGNLSSEIHSQFDRIKRDEIAPIILEIVNEGIMNKEFKAVVNSETIVYLIFDGISSSMHTLSKGRAAELEVATFIKGVEELFELVLGKKFNFINSEGAIHYEND